MFSPQTVKRKQICVRSVTVAVILSILAMAAYDLHGLSLRYHAHSDYMQAYSPEAAFFVSNNEDLKQFSTEPEVYERDGRIWRFRYLIEGQSFQNLCQISDCDLPITVRNCKFDQGIRVTNASNIKIDHCYFLGGSTKLEGCSFIKIRQSLFSQTEDQIRVQNCKYVDIIQNEFADYTQEALVYLDHSSSVRVTQNSIHDGQSTAIYLDFCSIVYITDNQLASIGSSGVVLMGGQLNAVQNNTFIDTQGPAVYCGRGYEADTSFVGDNIVKAGVSEAPTARIRDFVVFGGALWWLAWPLYEAVAAQRRKHLSMAVEAETAEK